MNWNQHVQNRSTFPAEELKQHHGRHVAWSLDGTRIVASGDDDAQVYHAALAAGFASDEFILSYVPRPNEILLGGVFVAVEEKAE